MKLLFIPVSAALFLLCAGCGTSSVIVLDKKEPKRPFSKMLVVYLDEPCDYTVLDSIAYNICLKSRFINSDSLGVRNREERMLAEDLRSSGTEIVSSSDLFGTTVNSYGDFKKVIDKLAIDAILVVDLHIYTSKTQYMTKIGDEWHTSDEPQSGYRVVRKYDGAFECNLIDPKNIYFPVWKAELEIKGTMHNKVKRLDRKMTQALRKTLEKSGYVAH